MIESNNKFQKKVQQEQRLIEMLGFSVAGICLVALPVYFLAFN